jgi:phospholipase/lecithinase/hemolysin
MDSLFFNSDMHFLFWDIVHPTTEAHQRLAEEIHLQLGNAYK